MLHIMSLVEVAWGIAHDVLSSWCMLELTRIRDMMVESPTLEHSEYLSQWRERIIKELEDTGHQYGQPCGKNYVLVLLLSLSL